MVAPVRDGGEVGAMSVRVLIADDHAIVRQGVKTLLEREGFDVIGEAADGREAVRCATQLSPDVAVLDLSMPLLDGLDTAQEIAQISPETRTILLTMHAEEPYVVRALHVGIKGYVLKSQTAAELIGAIQEVVRGGVYFSPGVSGAIYHAYQDKADGTNQLSARERQVLQLVAEGKTTKEVGQVLGISVKTADSHRSRLMSKLDIHDTAGLVRYAIREGLVRL
jgi:DNA-binding NarL/FixJ family response regulator